MDAIVIGGGIGGSVLALALHASGVARRIRVFEAASEMRALGIGIHIGAHAMKELSALGLEDALVATSCQPLDYAFFTRNGQLVYREPFGKAAGHLWPHITLLRPDLQRVLLTATVRSLSAQPITQPLEVPRLRRLLADPDRAFFPQVVLRLGYGPPVGGGAPRRPISDVVMSPL